MLHLFSARKVRVLLYNDQTVSPITIRVRAAARAAGIPVVGVSETLPPHRRSRAGSSPRRGRSTRRCLGGRRERSRSSRPRASLASATRALWSDLSFQLGRGELLAVLGPNGVGKTSLMRVLLGLQRPTAGRVRIKGRPAPPALVYRVRPPAAVLRPRVALRGRDLVGLGLDGHRFGFGLRSAADRERIERALADTGSVAYGNEAVGRLSGGEQQRLRVAQALVSRPNILLAENRSCRSTSPISASSSICSTDIAVRAVRRSSSSRTTGTPWSTAVTRVLYLAERSWAIGTVEEVMTSETLSQPLRDRRRRARSPWAHRRDRHTRPTRTPLGLMFWELLHEHFVHSALIAGALVAVVSGAVGSFVVARSLSFAVHAISELGFTGPRVRSCSGSAP